MLSIEYFIRYYFPSEILNLEEKTLSRDEIKEELNNIEEIKEYYHTPIINSDRLVKIILNIINMNAIEKVMQTGLMPKIKKIYIILSVNQKYVTRGQKNYVIVFDVKDPVFIYHNEIQNFDEMQKTNIIIYLFMRKFLSIGTNYQKNSPILLQDRESKLLFGLDFGCEKQSDLVPKEWLAYYASALEKIEAAINSKEISILPMEAFKEMRIKFAIELDSFKFKNKNSSKFSEAKENMDKLIDGSLLFSS